MSIKFSKDSYLTNLKRENYFERWQFQFTSKNKTYFAILGFVRGIDEHCFIQFQQSQDQIEHYFRFPIEDFFADTNRLKIKIKDNLLTEEKLILNLQADNFKVKVNLTLTNVIPFKTDFLYRSSMGPYKHLPKIVSLHNVISVHLKAVGNMTINDVSEDITSFGYLEKSYGSALPKWWLWTAAVNERQTFMFTLQNLEYLNKKVTNFSGFFYDDGKQYTFAKYDKTIIKEYQYEGNFFYIQLENKEIVIDLLISKNQLMNLTVPHNGEMERKISAGGDTKLKLNVFIKDKKASHEYIFNNVGLTFINIPEFFE